MRLSSINQRLTVQQTPSDSVGLFCVVSVSVSVSVSAAAQRDRLHQLSMTSLLLLTCYVFGHIARANPSMDHSRALRASVAPLPRDWNRRAGRPRHTRLRTVESDLAPFNIGLATAYHRAQNRQAWSKLVGTAASSSGQAT